MIPQKVEFNNDYFEDIRKCHFDEDCIHNRKDCKFCINNPKKVRK